MEKIMRKVYYLITSDLLIFIARCFSINFEEISHYYHIYFITSFCCKIILLVLKLYYLHCA